MKVLCASLLILGVWAFTGDAIICYECNYKYSVQDGTTEGDVACADASWGLNSTSDSIAIACRICFKEFYDLGADRFEVVRGCASGLPPPINGVTAWDRQQQADTCATTDLKAGDFSRCACSTDLCNAAAECDTANNCFADQCPDLTCETTCPPDNGSRALQASLAISVVIALSTAATWF